VTWRPPGSSSSPVSQRSVIYKRGLQALGQLTSFNRLLDSLTDSTLRRHICLLCLESSTCIAVAALIHSFLQRAFFPPEDIVAVLAVAGSSHLSALHRNVWTNPGLPVTHGVHKGLGAVVRPDALVVEKCSVPHDLVHQLRHLERMRRRARASRFKRSARRIRDVVLVVRAVEIFAVPASVHF
jgi:hypothetical protein